MMMTVIDHQPRQPAAQWQWEWVARAGGKVVGGEEGVGDQLLMRIVTRGEGGSLTSAWTGGNPALEAPMVEVQEGARSAICHALKGCRAIC